MWLFTKSGFVSVVQSRDDKTKVLVRARVRKDLVDFIPESVFKAKYINRKEIRKSHDSDYKYRLTMDRGLFTFCVLQQLEGITYDNFKSTVESDTRHNIYMNVWSDVKKLTEYEHNIVNGL